MDENEITKVETSIKTLEDDDNVIAPYEKPLEVKLDDAISNVSGMINNILQTINFRLY